MSFTLEEMSVILITEINLLEIGMTVPQTLVLNEIRKGQVPFVELRERLRMTDGNLFSHARKLQRMGFITVHKEFKNLIPLTSYKITVQGREYLRTLVKILQGGK